MATLIQTNTLIEFQKIVEEILKTKNKIGMLTALYTNENIGSLTTDEIQAIPGFEHVTAQELSAAAAALLAINTTLGEYSGTSNTMRLVRILSNLP